MIMKKNFVHLYVVVATILVMPSNTPAQQGWVTQTSGTTSELYGVSLANPTTGIVVGGFGTILRTTNGGNDWISQASGTTEWLYGVSFIGNIGTAVGSSGTILRTTNGGTTWTTQTTGTTSYLYGVSFSDANTGTAVGWFGTILRTTNGGATWTPQNSGTSNWLYGVSFIDINTGTVVGSFGTILRTTNGGTTWVQQTSSTTSELYAVSMNNAITGTAVGNFGTILRTTNGGNSWITQPSGTTSDLHGVSTTSPLIGTAIGSGGAILRTTNGGATWTSQASGTTNTLRSVFFASRDTGTVVGSSGLILHTTTGGNILSLTSPNGGEVWVIGTSRNILWTSSGVDQVKIEYTTNSGMTWTLIVNNTPAPSGSYSWTIPNTSSIQCKVRISSIDGTSLDDTSNASFTITQPPSIAVSPDSLTFIMNEGDSVSSILLISNLGPGILAFDLQLEYLNASRYRGIMLNVESQHDLTTWRKLPPVKTSIGEHQTRFPGNIFESATSRGQLLPLILGDSSGDGGPVDIVEIRGISSLSSLELQFVFASPLNPNDFGGYLGLDTDQNPGTGIALPFGLGGQDVGCEYFVVLFDLANNVVSVFDQNSSFVGNAITIVESNSFRFVIPNSMLGNDDGIMNLAAVVGNNSGPTDWIPDTGHGTVGLGWISLNQINGVLSPGDSLGIVVGINSEGLDGGNFFGNLLVNSNDPMNPMTTVPIHLTVIGNPNLVVPNALQFGTTFVGFPDTLELLLRNTGSLTLFVSNMTMTNSTFDAVGTTSFNILPSATRIVSVFYSPITEGLETGVLTIFSNDPDSTATVNLVGTAIHPPVISVLPDSFYFDRTVGDSVTTQMIVNNSGLGPLSFRITDREVQTIHQIHRPSTDRYRRMAPSSQRFSPIDLPRRISLRQDLYGQDTKSTNAQSFERRNVPPLPLLVADPIGDGGVADLSEIRGSMSSNELRASIVFAPGTNMDSVVAILGLDIDQNQATGAIDSFYYHDLGVEYFLYYFPSFEADSILVVHFNAGLVGAVPFEINGESVTFSVVISLIGGVDRTMDFIALSGKSEVTDWAPDQGHATINSDVVWLSSAPDSGTVAPGENTSIDLAAITGQLIGGNYNALITISNNDPARPLVEVPFSLHLTGIPNISISSDTLDFGLTYIGYHTSLQLTISSVGTDTLSGSAHSNSPLFVVGDSTFTLPVGSLVGLEIEFHPAEVGIVTSTLTINSNAGATPLAVVLRGAGVVAPNIVTDSTSFSFALNSGDTLTSSFKIFNTGGSVLDVEISDEVTSLRPGNAAIAGERLFGAESNMISEFNLNTGEIINTFPTPVNTSSGPTGLAFSGTELFFADAFSSSINIFVLDPQSGIVIRTFAPPSTSIDGLAFLSPYLYAMDYSLYQIYELDPLNGTILRTITPPVIIGGGIDGASGRLFASNFSSAIFELRITDGSVVSSFTPTQNVYGLAFTGERLFASNPIVGIAEYDPNTGAYLGQFASVGFSALAGGGGGDASWLEESSTEVAIAAGDSATVQIRVIPSQIAVGSYHANIILLSNDPDSSVVRIPVTMDILTGIDEEDNTLPREFALHQNYPNPFNPATNIHYDLPRESKVSLTIFNVIGQEVTTLVNEVQTAGRYKLRWDARNLASGIYLYRLIAGEFVQTKKMMIVK